MMRSVADIEAHILQVTDSVMDSQEHCQIVRLGRRLEELREELQTVMGGNKKAPAEAGAKFLTGRRQTEWKPLTARQSRSLMPVARN